MPIMTVIEATKWLRKLVKVMIMKKDMDRLVMDFLVAEGYAEAAVKFLAETGTETHVDFATLNCLAAVKDAVLGGNIEEAIENANNLNPMILKANPLVSFHLHYQRLIELIRNGETEEALHVAQEDLAPKAEDNPSSLEELERAITLLAFEDKKDCPYGELLDELQCLKVASEVNDAILVSQGYKKGPNILSLLKRLIWAQKQLDEDAIFPHIYDLKKAALQYPLH